MAEIFLLLVSLEIFCSTDATGDSTEHCRGHTRTISAGEATSVGKVDRCWPFYKKIGLPVTPFLQQPHLHAKKMPHLYAMVRKLVRAVNKTVHPDRIYMSADISVHSIETAYSPRRRQEQEADERSGVCIYTGSGYPLFEIYRDPAPASLPSFSCSIGGKACDTDSALTCASTLGTNATPVYSASDIEDLTDDEGPNEGDDDDMLYSNGFPLLRVSIRAKGRPVHNTTSDRLDLSTILEGMDVGNAEGSNDQRRIAEIAEEEAGRQQQQRDEIRAYQMEFPTIFDEDFVEILLSEEVVFDPLTNTSIIEEQLLVTQHPNFIGVSFQPYTYTHFNHGEENNMHAEANINTLPDLNSPEYYSLQEQRYLTMQFRRYKNGWRPSSRVLYQLEDNEINRLHNSGSTITVGIFNRVDFHNNRLVMFI